MQWMEIKRHGGASLNNEKNQTKATFKKEVIKTRCKTEPHSKQLIDIERVTLVKAK